MVENGVENTVNSEPKSTKLNELTKDVLNIDEKIVTNENSKEKDWFKKYRYRISFFSAISTFFVTAALAVISYCNLDEIKSQRDQIQSQFVLQNRPSVFIEAPKKFDFTENFAKLRWQIKNFGESYLA